MSRCNIEAKLHQVNLEGEIKLDVDLSRLSVTSLPCTMNTNMTGESKEN